MTISDDQAGWYNWKKNPGAAVTLVGIRDSRTLYRPHPYADDDRNADDALGARVARGGSWYSASTALLGTSSHCGTMLSAC